MARAHCGAICERRVKVANERGARARFHHTGNDSIRHLFSNIFAGRGPRYILLDQGNISYGERIVKKQEWDWISIAHYRDGSFPTRLNLCRLWVLLAREGGPLKGAFQATRSMVGVRESATALAQCHFGGGGGEAAEERRRRSCFSRFSFDFLPRRPLVTAAASPAMFCREGGREAKQEKEEE